MTALGTKVTDHDKLAVSVELTRTQRARLHMSTQRAGARAKTHPHLLEPEQLVKRLLHN